MENVLITGASGFIGRNLLRHIEALKKYNIVLLTSKQISGCKCILYPENDSLLKKNIYTVGSLAEAVEIGYMPENPGGGYKCTIDDFRELGIDHFDIVIHAGAFAPIIREDQNNVKKNSRTVLNTQRLLNVLPGKTGRFILISSCSVYGLYNQSADVVIDEYASLRPDTQYGLAKYSCELLVKDWALRNNVDYQILRLSNIYGPGDNKKNSLISTWINNAIEGKSIEIYGNPDMPRNFLFIDELCNKIIDRMNSEIQNETMNLVSDNETLGSIAKAVVKASRSDIKIVITNKPDMCFANIKFASRYSFCDKFHVGIEKGIQETYNYMKGCKSDGKAEK